MTRSRLSSFVTLLAALAPALASSPSASTHVMMAAEVHFGLVTVAAAIAASRRSR